MRFYYNFCLLPVLFFCPLLHAQTTLTLDDWKEYKFRNIGPAGMSGRITAIDVDPFDDSRIFLGAASGGLWLSENGGISFRPIFDDQSNLSIGSIKINPRNPSHIWVGTGEGNPRNSLNTGNGIYKSLDGGLTWKCMGLENTKVIHRIIINKDNPDIVYAAAMGSPWGPTNERGVYKTIDGGITWKRILFVNNLTGAADMIADPTNPDKLIASMWEHERKPWFFNSGGEGSGLYITYNGGDSWDKIEAKDGLPKGKLGRIGLAIAASKPQTIYALVEAKENGLYKSEDGGKKWRLVQNKDIGGRPFYYSEIYVDPQNENRLYNVHTYLSRSDDGGKSFYNIADYGNAVHPDHHALWIHPQQPSFLIDGNDGGAAISKDMGKSWTFISNLPVGQFYHVNVDNANPYNVYGGMQDNGSWVGPSAVLKPGGIRNSDFRELYFGDGFDVLPVPNNPRYCYAMSQGGNVALCDIQTGQSRFIKPNHPEGLPLRFNWNAAIAQSPFDSCSIYFGSQFLHHSRDCGRNWKIISPDLTTNDSTKQQQQKTGGLTYDVTGAENHTTIVAIAPSPLDPNLVWVGTDDGNVQLTIDGGNTWQNLSGKLKGMPAAAWVPQIVASPNNKGEAWVVVNNYRQNDYSPYAYYTQDYGRSWKRIADEKQIKGFVLSFVADVIQPNLWFLGTDVGLYISLDGGEHWQQWSKGLPQVQISDMKIQEKEGDLIIATFGRALWILDNLNPLRELAKGTFTEKDSLQLFASSDTYDWNFRSYDGVRFYAQGDFSGSNENKGQANLYLWTAAKDKKSEDNAKVKESESKIKVRWLNEAGDTIRKYTVKANGGLQAFSWGMNEDGKRRLSRRDVEKDADLPGGVGVLPGRYKCIVIYNNFKDSTWLTVKADPRIFFDESLAKAKVKLQKEFEVLNEKAGLAYTWVRDAKKQIKSMDGIKVFQQDSIKKQLEKMTKPLNAQLDSLEALFFLPEDTKGIAYDDDKITSKLQNAESYLSTSDGSFSGNALHAIKEAEDSIADALQAIKKFDEEKWKPYEQKLKGLSISLFPIQNKLE